MIQFLHYKIIPATSVFLSICITLMKKRLRHCCFVISPSTMLIELAATGK